MIAGADEGPLKRVLKRLKGGIRQNPVTPLGNCVRQVTKPMLSTICEWLAGVRNPAPGWWRV